MWLTLTKSFDILSLNFSDYITFSYLINTLDSSFIFPFFFSPVIALISKPCQYFHYVIMAGRYYAHLLFVHFIQSFCMKLVKLKDRPDNVMIYNYIFNEPLKGCQRKCQHFCSQFIITFNLQYFRPFKWKNSFFFFIQPVSVASQQHI